MDEGLLCTGAQHMVSKLSQAALVGPSVWEGRMARRAVLKCDEVGKGRGWGALGTHTELPRGW